MDGFGDAFVSFCGSKISVVMRQTPSGLSLSQISEPILLAQRLMQVTMIIVIGQLIELLLRRIGVGLQLMRILPVHLSLSLRRSSVIDFTGLFQACGLLLKLSSMAIVVGGIGVQAIDTSMQSCEPLSKTRASAYLGGSTGPRARKGR